MSTNKVKTNENKLAPICLFTYNRLQQTQKTIEALQKNYLAVKSELFIFSDGSKSENDKGSVLAVRNFLKTIDGFKTITISEADVNKGLANSIVIGVTQVLKEYDNVIVLEDDLETTPNFLNFMNSSLLYYDKVEQVQSISGYSLNIKTKLRTKNSDVFVHYKNHSWGWATWSKYWDISFFDKKHIQSILNDELLLNFKDKCGYDMYEMLSHSLSGKNNSWYARWCFNQFLNNNLTIYPYTSKVTNLGFGNENDATHCGVINIYTSDTDIDFYDEFNFCDDLNILHHSQLMKYYGKYYKYIYRLKLLKSFKGINLLIRDLKNRF